MESKRMAVCTSVCVHEKKITETELTESIL